MGSPGLGAAGPRAFVGVRAVRCRSSRDEHPQTARTTTNEEEATSARNPQEAPDPPSAVGSQQAPGPRRCVRDDRFDHRDRRDPQVRGAHGGGCGGPEHCSGNPVRIPGPQRRRQDDLDPDAPGADPAERGPGHHPGPGRGLTRRTLRALGGCRLPGRRAGPVPGVEPSGPPADGRDLPPRPPSRRDRRTAGAGKVPRRQGPRAQPGQPPATRASHGAAASPTGPDPRRAHAGDGPGRHGRDPRPASRPGGQRHDGVHVQPYGPGGRAGGRRGGHHP